MLKYVCPPYVNCIASIWDCVCMALPFWARLFWSESGENCLSFAQRLLLGAFVILGT